MKLIKYILVFCLILVFLVSLIIGGAYYYVKNHKKEIIDKVEELYAEKFLGEISVDDVTISPLKGYPFLSVGLSKVIIKDTTHSEHSEVINAEYVYVAATFNDILKQDIKFNNIIIDKAKFDIFTDSLGNKNLMAFKPRFLAEKDSTKKKKNWLENQIIHLKIQDSDLQIRDIGKNQRILIAITALAGNLNFFKEKVDAKIDLDVIAREVGFNLDTGTFFDGASLSGVLEPTFFFEDLRLLIPRFPMEIQKQFFEVQANVVFSEPRRYEFYIENDKTNYPETVKLLSAPIKRVLNMFKLTDPIAVKAKIKGNFGPGNKPLIFIDYDIKNNNLTVFDTLTFNNLNMTGDFINRLKNSDSTLKKQNGIHLGVDLLTTEYKKVPLKATNSSFVKSEIYNQLVTLNLVSEGKTSDLNGLLNTKLTKFTEGHYKLNSRFFGEFTNVTDMINKANSSIDLSNFNIVYVPTNLVVPIKKILAKTDKLNAILSLMDIPLPNGNDITIDGQINNFLSLLLTNNNLPVYSELNINSKILDFDYFIDYLKKKSGPRDASNFDLNTLYSLTGTVFNSFHPKISISIDEFNLEQKPFENFTSTFELNDEHTLGVRNGQFEFFGSISTVAGDIEVINTPPDQDQVFGLNMKFTSKGKADLFNYIFNNKRYLLQDGEYNFLGFLKGNASTLFGLIQTANGQLKFSNTNLDFVKLKLLIPITDMTLMVKNENAYLSRLDIPLPSGEEINVKGGIDNFSSLLVENPNQKVSSRLVLTNKHLDYGDFLKLFEGIQIERRTGQTTSISKLKSLLREIQNKLNPDIKVNLDEFTFKNIKVRNVNTFLNIPSGTFQIKLTDTGFDFLGGKINLDATLDISKDNITPFQADLSTSQLDIYDFLKTFNFFGLKSFQEATRIDGIINFSSSLNGEIIDSVGLDPSSFNGTITFDIENGEIKDFEPIVKVTQKFFKEQRFRDIKFAPIRNTINLVGRHAYIPFMEIQSTAFVFFIEGILTNENDSYIWITVPLKNLRRRNYVEAPPLEGLHGMRSIYIEAFGTPDGKMNYKLRLSKKKKRI